MSALKLTRSLAENLAAMRALFENDNTFVSRETRSPSGLHCAVFFFDGMVNNLAINQSIIRPLVAADRKSADADLLAHTIIQINDSRVEPDSDNMLSALLYGDTVILTEGDARPVVVNTKGFSLRTASEPENERVLRGPREGFTEAFMPNLALIRRRVNDPRLKFSFSRMAGRTRTVVCLCWIEGVTDPALLREARRRLDTYALDGILDANYLAEWIRDAHRSPFPTLGTTERPDVVVARLLEGRLAILTDGTPVALTAPCVLQECLQSNDDYYLPVTQAGLARALRSIGILLSMIVPALYLALLYHHAELLPTRMLLAITAAQKGVPLPPLWETLVLLIVFEILKEASARTYHHAELLPTRMLLAITAAQKGVPLPPLWETLVLLIVFEILKEASARTPGVIGSTMSIVGGLVLGQSAVSARLISAPAVIIVAAAAVTGLAAPKLQAAALMMRFALLFCGAAFGLYGLLFGLALMLLHLCALHSFGTPYLLNLLPRVHAHTEDLWMRTSWNTMRSRRFLARKERQ